MRIVDFGIMGYGSWFDTSYFIPKALRLKSHTLEKRKDGTIMHVQQYRWLKFYMVVEKDIEVGHLSPTPCSQLLLDNGEPPQDVMARDLTRIMWSDPADFNQDVLDLNPEYAAITDKVIETLKSGKAVVFKDSPFRFILVDGVVKAEYMKPS